MREVGGAFACHLDSIKLTNCESRNIIHFWFTIHSAFDAIEDKGLIS